MPSALDYLVDHAMALTSDNLETRKRAALLLENDPVANRAMIVYGSTSNPMKLDKADVERRIKEGLSQTNEREYYGYLIKQLASSNGYVVSTAYNYLKNDPRIARVALDSVTLNGQKAITATQADNLIQMVDQVFDGEAAKANSRIESGRYSTSVEPSSFSVTNPNDSSAFIDVPKANPFPLGIEYKNPNEALLEYSKTIINSPESCSDVAIQEAASKLSGLYTKQYYDSGATGPSNTIPNIFTQSTLAQLFTVFKRMAPSVWAANGPDKDRMMKEIGSVVGSVSANDYNQAFAHLLNIASAYHAGAINLQQEGKRREAQLEEANKQGMALLQQSAGQAEIISQAQAAIAEAGMRIRSTQQDLDETKQQNQQLLTQINAQKDEMERQKRAYEEQAKFRESILVRDKMQSEEQNRKSLEEADRKLQQIQDQYNTAYANYTSYYMQYQAAQDYYEDLRSTLTTTLKRAKVVIDSKATVAELLQTLIKKYDSRTGEYEQLLGEKKALSEVNEQITINLKGKENEITQAIAQLKEQEGIIVEQKATIERLQASVVTNEGEISMYEEMERSYEARIKETTVRIGELETEIIRNKSLSDHDIQGMRTTIESLQSELKTVTIARNNQKSKINALTKSNNELKTKIKGFETNISLARSQEQDLKRKLEDLNRSKVESDAALSAAQNTINQLERSNKNLEEANSSLALQLDQANIEVTNLKIAQAQGERNGVLLEESQKRVEEYSKLKNNLEIELQETKSANKRLKKSIEAGQTISAARDQSNQALIKSQEDTIRRLRKQLDDARKTADISAKEIRAREGDNRKARNQILEQELKVNKLETALADANRRLKDLSASKAFVQTQWEEAQRQVDALKAEAENHATDVIMAGLDEEPPLAPAVVNTICNEARIQAGKQPTSLNVVTGEDKYHTAAPPRVSDSSQKKERARAVAKAVSATRKKVVARSAQRNNSIKTSGGRARNSGGAGGYVVGGRPDPIISPQGPAFWRSVYQNHYHLF